MFFRIKSTIEAGKARTSLIKISKILDKCNMKFSNITKYSRDTWKATFPSKSSNNMITNKMVQDAGITAFVPTYKISKKAVIKKIPKNMSMAEIKEIVKEENLNLLIASLFRLKRRNRETRKLEDSKVVCMKLRGKLIPATISILRAVILIMPYVQSIRICFKCCHLGHIDKFCESQLNPIKCLTCAGDHQSTRESPCLMNKKCINCGSPHNTGTWAGVVQFSNNIKK